MKAVIKKLLKRLLEICRAHTIAAEVAIGAEKPGLCWHLAEAPSAWQGLWLQGTEVLGEEPADHICGKEPRKKPCGSCRVPFSNTVQTQGLSSKETEVSHSMVHRRAHWKFLHIIIKVLKDMALFQNQKRIHCEILTLWLKYLLTFLSEASLTFSQRFAHFWQERIWPLSSIMLHPISTDCLFSLSLSFSHDVNAHCNRSSSVPLDLL